MTTVKSLLIDPEHRAIVNMVMQLDPQRRPSLYTHIRPNGKDILHADATPANAHLRRYAFRLDGETFYGSWVLVGFGKDFRDVSISARKLAGMIDWRGRTFAGCLMAARFQRLDLHAPIVRIDPGQESPAQAA
jgi:hypothetical protein